MTNAASPTATATLSPQSSMRKSCVSEAIRLAAFYWKAANAALHGQPTALLRCTEEEPTEDCGVRRLVSSTPVSYGRRLNTYEIDIVERAMVEYRFYLAQARSCADRSARFRRDGLGIWIC